MKQLGDDELTSIFMKINNKDDLKSFSQVSKQFMKIACVRLTKLDISFVDLLYDILPISPNLVSFECSKPLSNAHMKLVAQSCPKLQYLNLDLKDNNDHGEFDFDYDFNDDGLCAIANACSHLYKVELRKRLHVGDVGICALVKSSMKLGILDLGGCVNVTDKSLKAIGDTSRLVYLNLQGCILITDSGLEYLANGDLRNYLDELILAECDKISDDGIVFLTQMVNLTYLNLSKCGVNVTGSVVYLIPNIERLDLSWLIKVTDYTLRQIGRSCRKLREVNLTGCEGVTGYGLGAFAYSCKRLKCLGLSILGLIKDVFL